MPHWICEAIKCFEIEELFSFWTNNEYSKKKRKSEWMNNV